MKNVEIIFRKLLLRVLLLVSKRRHTNEALAITPGSKVLCIRLNRIGDALVSTALIHQLKKQTGCTIHMLADKKNHFVFQHNNDIENVYIFDKHISELSTQLKVFQQEHYDAVIDLHDDVSITVSFLMSLIDSKWKIGLEKENRILYTHTATKGDTTKTHVIDRLLAIGNILYKNTDASDANVYFPLPEDSIHDAKTFLAAHYQQHRPLIGVNISAGSEARFWGVQNFSKLLNHLEEKNFRTILLAAPDDQEKAEAILKTAQTKTKQFSAKNYHTFAAMIAHTHMLFTPDTAAVHIASAYKIPVFGLYVHDTEDKIWSPYQSEFDWVETTQHELHYIRFEDVAKKLDHFLTRESIQQIEK